jgi:hypothetical protein
MRADDDVLLLEGIELTLPLRIRMVLWVLVSPVTTSTMLMSTNARGRSTLSNSVPEAEVAINAAAITSVARLLMFASYAARQDRALLSTL